MTSRSAPPRVLVLAILAFGIGLLDAAAITHDRQRESERTPLAGSLLTFNTTAVRKLTIARSGKTPIVLERTAAGWVVASHKGYPARGGRVDGIIQRLASWKRERLAGEKASQTKFGVTSETGISVKLEGEQGRAIGELVVGSLSGVDSEDARANGSHIDPSKIGRYVRVLPDDSIYVVSDFVTGELEPEPSEWLERPAGGTEEGKVRGIQISHRLGAVVAFHLDPQDARLADNRPIDLEKARPIVRQILGLAPADVCVNEDDPRLGLATPRATFDVVLEGSPAPARMSVGDEVAGTGSATYPGFSPPTAEKWGPLVPVRITGRPSAVLVQASSLEPILTAKTDPLVLTHALSPRVDGVTRLELTKDGRTITLSQEGADWTVNVVGLLASSHKLAGEADTAARTRVIAAATTGLAIAGFDRVAGTASPVGHGLANPALTLVMDLGKTNHRELAIAPVDGEHAWAMRSDIPCALALPASAVAELVAAFDALPMN